MSISDSIRLCGWQRWSVSLPLWSRLKYHIRYRMNALKFDTAINGSQTINPTDFGDSLTFPLAPPTG